MQLIHNTGTREETAHHEAGHAVAAYLLGAAPLSLSIERDEEEGSRGYCQHEDWPYHWAIDGLPDSMEWGDRADIIVCLAGPAAAQRFTGRWNAVGGHRDLEWAEMTASGLDEGRQSVLGGSFRSAGEMLAEHWPVVQALAEALLAH